PSAGGDGVGAASVVGEAPVGGGPASAATRSQSGSQAPTVPPAPCSPSVAAGSRLRQTPHERSNAGSAAPAASSFQPGRSLHVSSASTSRGGGGVGVGVGEGAAVGAGVGDGGACSPC